MKLDKTFNPRLAAKKLLREARSGALATLMQDSGDPYCSLVNVATTVGGAPVLLLSKLAMHTKNILYDARVSLMLDERKEGDPLEGARVMFMGRCVRDNDAATPIAYLRRHPDAELYANFSDFSFYRMEIGGAHLVAGFGRIVDLKPQDVLTDTSDAMALVEDLAEPADVEGDSFNLAGRHQDLFVESFPIAQPQRIVDDQDRPPIRVDVADAHDDIGIFRRR